MVDMWQKDLLSLEVQKRMQTLTEGAFTVLYLPKSMQDFS